ncbi:hypothetical protein NDR89_15750 [Cupriavidus gilardii]|uniref:Uncharacterized protein n=1 Tax=Cupriavidus gilardii TaxID=82541 RepID=A0ABY4VVG2_9BURK|nr:hypothetical protein [Cupriavidus gilardii]USE81172.1 hypothetical protein NDR89_15750 [Cupriavidus gilardii]
MIDIPAGLAIGKQAFDIAKGMITLSKDAAVTSKAMELTQVILQLQEQLRDAGLEIDTLQRQIAALRDDLSKKDDLSRYRLHRFPTGDLVYQLDPEKANGEIDHCICARCYADGRKGPMRRGDYLYQCSVCGATADFQAAPPVSSYASGRFDPY